MRRSVDSVGLLGCGRMGEQIGGHLLDAGTRLVVYDPVEEARGRLVGRGAVEGRDPGDLAAQSDLVLVVVVDDAQVREAVATALERAREGSIVAVCSSVRPSTCRELAAAGARRGVHVIDAALVRGERGAEEGRLVLYCGGDEEVIARVREASKPFAEAVVRVGDVGAGQTAKLVNNILLWACLRADVEALRLGRALGVEPAALREAMALGSGANRPLVEWGNHRLRWPHKDLELALAEANEAGVAVPLVALLADLMADLTVDDLRELV